MKIYQTRDADWYTTKLNSLILSEGLDIENVVIERAEKLYEVAVLYPQERKQVIFLAVKCLYLIGTLNKQLLDEEEEKLFQEVLEVMEKGTKEYCEKNNRVIFGYEDSAFLGYLTANMLVDPSKDCFVDNAVIAYLLGTQTVKDPNYIPRNRV